MHTDDQIHRILIGAMLAEYRGDLNMATDLVAKAAAQHIDKFDGTPSYFGAQDNRPVSAISA